MAVVVIQTAIQPATGLRDLTDVRTFEHLTLDDVVELNNQRKREKEKVVAFNKQQKEKLLWAIKTKSYSNIGDVNFKEWADLYRYLEELLSYNTIFGTARFEIDYKDKTGVIRASDMSLLLVRCDSALQVQIYTTVNAVGTMATLHLIERADKRLTDKALDDFAILARTHRTQA